MTARTRKTKAEKFREQAEKRTTRALLALRAVEELADRKRFESTEEQRQEVADAVSVGHARVAKALLEPDDEPRFRFGD